MAGVTGYRFRVINTNTGQIQTIDRSLQFFSLTMLSSFHYGTTYLIDVATKTGLYFPANPSFGAPCMVTTPPIPKLSQYCNATVPTKGTIIPTLSLASVTVYRFEVTRWRDASLTSPVSVSILNRSSNWFTFNHITNYAPNTTYTVRVSLMTSGSFPLNQSGEILYGDACVIRSPSAARSIQQEDELFEAVVYPSPYDYQFNFKFDSVSNADFLIQVYDMMGKLIEDRKVKVEDMPNQYFGERYPSGVYQVILTQDDRTKVLRVVKK